MANKRLLKSSLEIPHLDGLVGRAAHEEILLLRETQLENRPWVRLYRFMLAVPWYSLPYTEFFQIRIYLSSPQEMTRVASALKSTSLTCPLWPTNLKGRICGLKFQTYTNPSAPPETICFLTRHISTSLEKIPHWWLLFNDHGSISRERGPQQWQWFLLFPWPTPSISDFKYYSSLI